MFFSVFFSLVGSLSAYAQDQNEAAKTYKNTTGLSALYTMPIGSFASKNLDGGGFAMPGWGLAFDSKSQIGKGFALVSYSTYSWNKLDANAMAAEFTKELNLTTQVDGGMHNPFFSTVGLFKRFDLNDQLFFGVSGQLGLLYNTFDSFTMTVFNNDGSINYEDVVAYKSGFAFAYTFTGEVNYTIVKDLIALHFEVDYSAANVHTHLTSNHVQPIKADERFQFVQLNLGIVIFNK